MGRMGEINSGARGHSLPAACSACGCCLVRSFVVIKGEKPSFPVTPNRIVSDMNTLSYATAADVLTLCPTPILRVQQYRLRGSTCRMECLMAHLAAEERVEDIHAALLPPQNQQQVVFAVWLQGDDHGRRCPVRKEQRRHITMNARAALRMSHINPYTHKQTHQVPVRYPTLTPVIAWILYVRHVAPHFQHKFTCLRLGPS